MHVPRPSPAHGCSPCPILKLKLNVNAATRTESEVGGVIRHHNGTVSACWTIGLLGGFSADVGELLAIRGGLWFAVLCSLSIDIFESDSSNDVNAIQRSEHFSSFCQLSKIKKFVKVKLEIVLATPLTVMVWPICLLELIFVILEQRFELGHACPRFVSYVLVLDLKE